jgi:hypothetical protein
MRHEGRAALVVRHRDDEPELLVPGLRNDLDQLGPRRAAPHRCNRGPAHVASAGVRVEVHAGARVCVLAEQMRECALVALRPVPVSRQVAPRELLGEGSDAAIRRGQRPGDRR